jgi:transitional endoplasmic reticulum ATPase
VSTWKASQFGEIVLPTDHSSPQTETFEFAGARFSIIDPAALLANLGGALVSVLRTGSFPEPVGEISIQLSQSAPDGRPTITLRSQVGMTNRAFEGFLHPGDIGVDYVAPLVDAVSRLLVPGGLSGAANGKDGKDSRAGSSWGWLFEEPAAGSPQTTTVTRDGLEATVTYGRTGLNGRAKHTLEALVAADAATVDHLRAFARMAFDVARQQAGHAGDDGFFKGRSYTISRQPVAAPATPEDDGAARLDQLGGLQEVVSQLRDVADSFKHPEVMARWGARRPQGILMSGPPGTGKTTLAKALATEIGATLEEIRTPDILEKWVGQSERNIKKIFTKARGYREPTVLLFDEFDSIISYTGTPHGSADQALNSVAGIFKQEMNTLVEENPNVIVVATTNFPDRVDQSLVRSGRFDIKLSVPLPDAAGRAEIFTKMIQRLIARHRTDGFAMFEDVDTARLAELTDGMSGADIQEVLRRVQMIKAMQEARGAESAGAISQPDLELAVSQMRRS